jgi:hypothetical protein
MAGFTELLTRLAARLTTWTILAGTAALPFVFLRGAKDAFRTPKEIAFHAVALVVLAALAAWSIQSGPRALFGRAFRPYALLLGAILAWVVLAGVFSSNRLVSAFALGHVFLSTIWFAASWLVARRKGVAVLLAVAIPGVVSACIALLQVARLWTPVEVEGSGRSSVIGIMGNPNDLGGYLALAAVPFAALAWTAGTRARVLSVVALGMLGAAVFVTESAASAGSLVAAVAAVPMAGLRRGKALVAVLAVLLVLALGTSFLASDRIVSAKVEPLLGRGLREALSARTVAYATAGLMIRENPVLGVGPGCFAFRYPDAQIRIFAENPEIAPRRVQRGMFVEVHNDHLEIAAETGIPGALLEIVALAMLFMAGGRGRERETASPASLGRLGAWSLGACLLVQMTFNFPLQISGILAPALFLAGTFIAWQSA